ncbi:MAG: GIY-YIG nuclease family protein [Elusimicrobia bacterium]|nr:GIY-YIG nuclease family protein [Elusimicrobiota bacterium]
MQPDISRIPHVPGVYLMLGPGRQLLYVGKANDLARRIGQYFSGHEAHSRPWTVAGLMALVRRVDYIPCASERDALILERRLVQKNQPFFNRDLRDGKAYPFVRLSMQEDFPRLSISRRAEDDGAAYFGPYPKASSLNALLRHLWVSGLARLRPCRWEFSLKNPLPDRKIKHCVYYHTGQCAAPCAGKISRAAYRRIALRAKLLLEGKTEKLKTALERQMAQASSALRYEEAAECRNCLLALKHMSEKVRISRKNQADIELAVQESRAAQELAKALGLQRAPVHIEAFDTSSLFARQAVGSSVCFVNGEKNSGHYRKYRIKSALPETGSDDFLMMREIVSRRLRQLLKANEPLPDLLLIDGGPGQLAAAAQGMVDAKCRLPLAALAKKEEELFLPGRRESLRLPRNSRALLLLMRLRDEAHRFGVTYHRSLRNKRLLP